MGKFWNNTREFFLMLAMAILVVFGFVGGAGSINYGVSPDGNWIYIIAGIVAIANSALTGVSFHNRFLKPKK